MSPTRRTVLRTSGLVALAAVAGCTSSTNGPGDQPSDSTTTGADGTTDSPGTTTDGSTETTGEPTDSTPPNGTETGDGSGGTRPAGTGGPGISLTEVDDEPDLPVTPSVEVTKDAATDDHPPQLKVTVTNDSDGTVSVGEGREIVFSYVTDESGALVLLPAQGDYSAEPGCWRLSESVAITADYQITELKAGESVSQKVDLYGTADGDACLPVGEFRFQSTYNVAEGKNQTPDGETQANWGFSLALE